MKLPPELLAVLGAPIFIVLGWLAWRRNTSTPPYEAAFRVELDEQELRVTDPKGAVGRLKRVDLASVVIETNDSGPVGADFWWLLTARDGTVAAIPMGATGEQVMVDWVTSLPSFDREQWQAARTSTRNAVFWCWRATEG